MGTPCVLYIEQLPMEIILRSTYFVKHKTMRDATQNYNLRVHTHVGEKHHMLRKTKIMSNSLELLGNDHVIYSFYYSAKKLWCKFV
jgi:hypothetical protein